MQNWISELQDLDFEIFYKTGKSNVVADSLSRNPCLEIIKEAISYFCTSAISPEVSKAAIPNSVAINTETNEIVYKPVGPEVSKATVAEVSRRSKVDNKIVQFDEAIIYPEVSKVDKAPGTFIIEKKRVGRPRKGFEKTKTPIVKKYNLRERKALSPVNEEDSIQIEQEKNKKSSEKPETSGPETIVNIDDVNEKNNDKKIEEIENISSDSSNSDIKFAG